jgi:hypothetical protein
VRESVEPSGPFELVKERPWATVWRVPVGAGAAYAKACRPIQAFEPTVTAALAGRWPAVVAEVLAIDEDRAWMLTADAGVPLGDLGNPPELWEQVLPRYAELQRGEVAHADAHRRAGVPDLGLRVFADRFDELLDRDLPIEAAEVDEARRLRPNLEALVRELGAAGIGDSIEHADLHLRSVFENAGHLRVLDWGDASVAHPFFSLVVTFAFLRDANGLVPDDPWFDRLRDAYLEPWGGGLVPAFEVAQRLGRVSRAIGWGRHYASMGEGAFPAFDEQLPDVLRTAIAALRTTLPA